jgi:ComF family protein
VVWRQVADALLSALLAPPCAVCGRVLDEPLVGAVCRTCWLEVVLLRPPLCVSCGDALPSWRVAAAADGRCVRCRRGESLVTVGRSVGPYDGILRDIIHALKYDGRRSLAPTLASLMRQHGAEVLTGAAAAVPVPLHPRRERERGFNQADDLAQGLGLPVLRALRRVRSTKPQVELPAAQRHRNVKDAFAPTSHITGQIVVLVDDVTTTGATLSACARVLRDAGAAEVRALTAARVVIGAPALPPPSRHPWAGVHL